MKTVKPDIETLWQRNIDEARRIVASKVKNQIEIAKLALEVCEVERGGDRTIKDLRFTLVNFARDAGINPKTLYSWCMLKRNVYDKLTEANRHKVKFSHLTYINRRVNSCTDARNVNEAVERLFSNVGIDRMILRYICEVMALTGHLKKPNFLALVDRKTAEELSYQVGELTKYFRERCSKVSPVNHMNAARYSNRSSLSATLVGNMKTSDGVWIKMSEKDELVYRHLLQVSSRGRYAAPSSIGMIVGKKLGRKFKRGSPFASRSLSKLARLGLAEKNKNGHWRALRKDLK